jgi:hypothetical protein
MVFVGTRSGEPNAVSFNTHAPLIETGTTRHIPDMLDILSGRGPEFCHIHLRLIPIEEVPSDETKLKTWLYGRWQDKEKLLAHFHEHGEFPGDNWAQPLGQLYDYDAIRDHLFLYIYFCSPNLNVHVVRRFLLRYLYAWVAWAAAVVWMLRFVPPLVWQILMWSLLPTLFIIYKVYQRQKVA